MYRSQFFYSFIFLISYLLYLLEKTKLIWYNLNDHSLCYREGGTILRPQNEEARRAKQIEIMENSFNCYADNGFSSVGVKAIAKACDCSVATLYLYFENLDDLIVKSTEYCMSKVEDEFMAKAPPMWRTYGVLLTRSPTGRQKTRQEITADVSGLYSPQIQRIRSEVL